MEKVKNVVFPVIVMVFCIFISSSVLIAEEENEIKIYKAGEVQVTARGAKVTVEPEKTTIELEHYETVGTPQNVGDIVSCLAIIDSRSPSGLTPDDDTLFMRGFSSKRFVTALDGMTIRKTGGRRSSHIVDYALLPPFLIEKVEVIPGSHSALYPGKSIGGTLNFQTREPTRRESLRPDLALSIDYGSYDTRTHSVTMQTGAGGFVCDLSYQKYATNGYLRHSEVDIDTVFGRFSYVLPNEGYFSLTASYADADRNRAVVNDPANSESEWDSDYPLLEKAGRIYYDWQNPTWDKISPNYRFNMKIPSPLGTWFANLYYGEENRDNSLMVWVDSSDHSQGITDGSWDTQWHQQGGRIYNEFSPVETHKITVGAELEQCYDGYGDVPGWNNSGYAHDDKKRIEIISGFAQDQWQITPVISLKAGLRFEDTTIYVSNFSSSSGNVYISNRSMWIKRNWSEVSPKSFLTYKLDNLTALLRDTSVSCGISRIWRAPDYHGDYNPQGRPAGAWLEPEHGIGYDLVLNRRLAGNIQMKINYSFCQIKDYIATNNSYASMADYQDYKINLDEVVRHGIEFQLSGDITDDLTFLFGYAWQDFDNKGNEPAGETELDDRAPNHATAKLTYRLSDKTSVTIDYEYQDEQVVESATEVSPGVYDFDEIPMEEFHVADLSIKHNLFKKWMGMKEGTIRFYVNNLTDENYTNSSGYPATDLTAGVGFDVRL